MATIGYVTLEEANSYVSNQYTSTDPARVRWNALSNPDKEALLRQSFDVIEGTPIKGCKSDPSQLTMFPRSPDTEVPQRVKYAQIENSITLTDTSIKEESEFYEKLHSRGISSFSMGNTSEAFNLGAGSIIKNPTVSLVSPKAISLMRPYTSGGFVVHGWGCK